MCNRQHHPVSSTFHPLPHTKECDSALSEETAWPTGESVGIYRRSIRISPSEQFLTNTADHLTHRMNAYLLEPLPTAIQPITMLNRPSGELGTLLSRAA